MGGRVVEYFARGKRNGTNYYISTDAALFLTMSSLVTVKIKPADKMDSEECLELGASLLCQIIQSTKTEKYSGIYFV